MEWDGVVNNGQNHALISKDGYDMGKYGKASVFVTVFGVLMYLLSIFQNLSFFRMVQAGLTEY